MKLTSEEFNAIFTFYDKVRGLAVSDRSAGGPITRVAPQLEWLHSVLRNR